MFGIGPSELIFILVIALLVLGPKRLPELAAGIGKGLAEFRRATADINAELDDARRSLEDQARDATRNTQPDRRVSRTQRTPPREASATVSAADDAPAGDDVEHSAQPETAAAHAAETPRHKSDPDPKGSA